MLTAIKGTYDNGQVILTEDPRVNTKTDVIVTFLLEDKEPVSKGGQKIILGMLEGKIRISDDFNEPLDDLKDYM